MMSLSIFPSCSSENGHEHERFSGLDYDSEMTFVVIHSYNELGQEGYYFRKYMSDHMKDKHRLSPVFHHVYLDLVHNDNPVEERMGGRDAFINMISECRPDVLLVNDDLAFDYLFDRFDTLFRMFPTVFAGVSAPREWNRSEYPLLTGLADPVDLAANCELFNSLTRGFNPVVELDHSDFDTRLRNLIYSNISDTNRYVNNGDFHIRIRPGFGENADDYKGKIVINFMSMEDRSSNRLQNMSEVVGLHHTTNMLAYTSTSQAFHIQVKYDIFSNELIDVANTPQYTCIREQFSFDSPDNVKRFRTGQNIGTAGSHAIFLAGYFTGVETQIEDQLHYALRILGGEKPENLPVQNHAKNKYMDWRAMQLMDPPMDYKDYCNEFVIVNVPFKVKYHFLYCLTIVLAVLLAVALTVFLTIVRIRRENSERDSLLLEMERESSKRRIAMGGRESGFFMIDSGNITLFFSYPSSQGQSVRTWSIGEFKSKIHPDSHKSFELLADGRVPQSGSGRIRLCYDLDGDGWHWWDIFFCENEMTVGSIVGICINIDSVVAYENSVQQSMDRAVEVSAKQNFIANITHDIRTPLNAVAGFAQLLAEGCSDEDRIEYAEIISMNTEQLLNLIDSAVKMPADSTDVMSIKLRDVDMAKLLEDSFRTNRILKPAHLEFHFEPGGTLENGKVPVRADSVRTSQVINNFVSNAFKYTLEGSVTLGWRIVDDIFVEVYVKDTGIGISEEDAKIIHERYSMAHDNNRGTGLGLDICRTIIQKQDGEYGFTSKVGQGSRFWFRLPMIQ